MNVSVTTIIDAPDAADFQTIVAYLRGLTLPIEIRIDEAAHTVTTRYEGPIEVTDGKPLIVGQLV